MQKPVLFSLLLLSTGLAADQNQETPQFELGLAFVTDSALALPENAEASESLVPSLSFGFGFEQDLDKDWKLTNNLSLSYAQTDIKLATALPGSTSTNVENTGLWLDSTFSYRPFKNGVNPFVSMGVGKVYGKYQDGIGKVSSWATGYRAMAGFEFEIDHGTSFSIAVGTADISALE